MINLNMEKSFFIDIEILQSGYIYLNDIHNESDILNSYQYYVDTCKKIGTRTECLEGFKKKYIYLKVKYDGRKGVKNEDVMKSLVRNNLAIDTKNTSIFGNFYEPTENLKRIFDEQIKKRKQLAGIN